MDFNNESDKVIGIVDHKLGEESARIKIIGILKEGVLPYLISDFESQRIFPSKGYVFEPGFFYNYHFKVKDIVSFYISENEKNEPGKDMYRLRLDYPDIKNFGVPARRLEGFRKKGFSTDLSTVKVENDQSDGDFYGVTNKYIIGKLRMKNGRIEPVKHRRIKLWDIDDYKPLSYKDILILHEEPSHDFLLIDCLSDQQLFEWFREKLRKIQPDFVTNLDAKTQWRKQIPELFSKADDESYEVDKERFNRVLEKIKYIELEVVDIRLFIEKSEELKAIFKDSLERHKEEFKQEYVDELDQLKSSIDEKKQIIKNELLELEQVIEEKNEKISSLNEKIEILKKNKSGIISDFQIIKEVLLSTSDNSQSHSDNLNESYYVEEINPGEKLTPAESKDDFVNNIKFELARYRINPNYAGKLTSALSIFKAIIIKDIRLGLALIRATNNAVFIQQNTSPKWLSFFDLWENGLKEIVIAAANNPNRLHFFILQDLNLASPECYARPLLDVIAGTRSFLPYGKIPYPKNLKILVTKAPVDSPELGLPLIEASFNSWASVGFLHDIYQTTNDKFEPQSKFIDFNFLEKIKPENFDEEDIIYGVKSENKAVFDF